MRWPFRLAGWLLMCWGLASCQPPDPGPSSVAGAHRDKPQQGKSLLKQAALPGIRPDWHGARDCREMLAFLQAGLANGQLVDLEGTPFLLIDESLASGRSEWSRLGGVAGQAAWGNSGTVAIRCVIRVDRALDRRSEHKILGQEQVRSRYQSGTRREKNPAYKVAEVRLRQAEKAAKPDKSSIMKVGDPLIDLVGTLVGGALTGASQWGAGDQLEEALDNLMATPPSIDHPVYKSYHFERARVRASREATLPILLTDRRLQQSWRTSLKRREIREFFMVTGLDRQDEDYARHSQNSLTEEGLRQWLAEPPSLPLADIAAGLLDHTSPAPLDRLAMAGQEWTAADARPFVADTSLMADMSFDAAASPALDLGGAAATGRSAAKEVDAGQIRIVGEISEASGVFIAPHFILAPSDVVGDRGLVDIEDAPGHRALGLVAAVDHGLGLVLVQSPLKGEPVPVGYGTGDDGRNREGRTGRSRAGRPIASSLERSGSAPRLVGGRLLGFEMAGGPDIDSAAIRLFLDRQQNVLGSGLMPPSGTPGRSVVSRP